VATIIRSVIDDPEWLVVALHGYGDDGASFAHHVAEAADGHRVAVVGPDGPAPAELAPTGRAWYPMTGRPDTMGRRASKVARTVGQRIVATQAELGIPARRTAVIAFSQGTTVASALLDRDLCARVALLCGRLTATPRRRPPELLVVTGSEDRFVPPSAVASDVADADLEAVTAHYTIDGLGHTVSATVTALAVRFAVGAEHVRAGHHMVTSLVANRQ